MEITTKPGDLHSENQRKSSPKLVFFWQNKLEIITKPCDFTSQPYENVEFNTKTRKQLGPDHHKFYWIWPMTNLECTIETCSNGMMTKTCELTSKMWMKSYGQKRMVWQVVLQTNATIQSLFPEQEMLSKHVQARKTWCLKWVYQDFSLTVLTF